MVSRLTSALVHGEPDAPESPLRRTSLGSFGGLTIGVLLVAAFLVWGLISPSGPAGPLPTGELVVAKETGARYIYSGHELWPVLNWSSALLLLGGSPKVAYVPAASLASVPQGQPLGIVGAPDTLPAAAAVNRGDWLACAEPQSAEPGASGPFVSLTIGLRLDIGQVPPGSAVIVADPGGRQYLLWNSRRLRLDASWIPGALGLGRAPVIAVSPVWLNAVPAGPDLRPVTVSGRGGHGPVIGGDPTSVGQILVAHNVGSPAEFYLAEAGGIAPVTSLQAALVLSDPATVAAYGRATVAPVPVSPAALVGVPVVPPPSADAAGAPSAPPSAYTPSGAGVPCMDYAGAGGTAPRFAFAPPPAGSPPALGMFGVVASPEGAGLITVVPGGGALVRPQSAPGVGGSSLFLVTDAGVKFPVPSATAALALGYSAGQAAALPAALLGLLPTGPALDLSALGGDQLPETMTGGGQIKQFPPRKGSQSWRQ
jgi:type VII secretion protein EccB